MKTKKPAAAFSLRAGDFYLAVISDKTIRRTKAGFVLRTGGD
jgi:hypothetical protein